MNTRWSTVKKPKLLWHWWNGEAVVYDDASGDTHLLDPVSAETLKLLEEAPSTAIEIRDALVELSQDHPGELNLATVQTLLRELARRNLIESLPS